MYMYIVYFSLSLSLSLSLSPFFQSLGEMVIGAFKHAGRRRMAFSIGTRMAEFHK